MGQAGPVVLGGFRRVESGGSAPLDAIAVDSAKWLLESTSESTPVAVLNALFY